MFTRVIDDFKQSANTALRLTSLGAIAAIALFVAVSFLCAAVFVYVLQTYGAVQACLTGAAIFFLVTLIVAALFIAGKNRARARAAQATQSTLRTALSDPMLVTAGVQLIRAIGVKRLLPILAVGGLALGLLASRSASTDETPAE
jgi:uncharacterized membrane protein YhfC